MKYLAIVAFGGAVLLVDNLSLIHKCCRWRKEASREFWRASHTPPPIGYDGPLFRPRLDFAVADKRSSENDLVSTASKSSLEGSWKEVDFRKTPEEYVRRVLRYCLQGNVDVDFDMSKKNSNIWFHAPWMSYWKTGREPVHGMTFERPASVGYLAEEQKRVCQVWAVAYYNHLGAREFSKIWRDPSTPNLEKPIQFPEDTVVFKLLYSDASEREVPYLRGSHEWEAFIAIDPKNPAQRKDHTSKLKLLQIDLAVKDKRSQIGWVFGTFMYHCNAPSTMSVKEGHLKNLVPVCVQWGNDPTFLGKKTNDSSLKETWNNQLLDNLG